MAEATMDMESDMGSAKKMANTLFVKKCGRIKISGISKMTFLRQAINREALAFPRAVKVCCTDIWMPNIQKAAMYMRRVQLAVSIISGELLNICTNKCGNSCSTSQKQLRNIMETASIHLKVERIREALPAP